MPWGSHTNHLHTALSLARYQGDAPEIERLERALEQARAECSHVPNPEHPERCYKCGVGLATRPALAKGSNRVQVCKAC